MRAQRAATLDNPNGIAKIMDASAGGREAATAGPETETLVARLEKVTGCGIAELATIAKTWI